MTDRLISAVVSIILGFLVWLYARSRDQELLDNVIVPVTIALTTHQAEQYDLAVTGPSQVTASFSGPPSRMRELREQLQRGELRVEKEITVPDDRQGESRFLETVRIDASELHPPPGVRAILAEERNRIPVTLRRIVERPIPVRLDYAPDEPVAELSIQPATVLVRGPQEILDRVRVLPTRPWLPPAPAEDTVLREHVTTGTVALVDELEGRPIQANPPTVTVKLALRPRERVYELVDVPVHFLCPPNFTYRAAWEDERGGKLTLRVRGPAGEEQPVVTAFVDLTHRKFDPGLYAEEPLRLQLPREFQLAQPPPRSAWFRLHPVPGDRATVPILGGPRGP